MYTKPFTPCDYDCWSGVEHPDPLIGEGTTGEDLPAFTHVTLILDGARLEAHLSNVETWQQAWCGADFGTRDAAERIAASLPAELVSLAELEEIGFADFDGIHRPL